MNLKVITLRRFRNYSFLDIELSPGFNYFYGPNGAGKTNFLEAIHFLIHLQSFRRVSRSGMIAYGNEGMYLRGDFSRVARGGSEVRLEAAVGGGGRKYKVDGVEIGNLSGYLGQVHSVVFFPESLRFVKGGPSLRRAVFDRAIASEIPRHLMDSRDYNHLLLERNRILKQRGDSDMMGIWERRLIDIAARIIVRRCMYLRSLRQLLNFLCESMGVKSILRIGYCVGGFGGRKKNWVETLGSMPPEKQESMAREVLQERAAQVKADENRRGTTLWGPHLDDFEVLWKEKRAKDTASQGEQRLIMIILAGAVAESYIQATGDGPIVLFDDLSSELDEEKREVVMKYLKSLKSQVFVTTTEKPPIKDETPGVKIYHVESGRITAP